MIKLADFNKNAIYNVPGVDGGFFWNGAEWVVIIRLNEEVIASDNIKLNLVKLILSEREKTRDIGMISTALYDGKESIKANDSETVYNLFSLIDYFGIGNDFLSLLVSQYLKEESPFVEQIKQFVELVDNDIIDIKEIADLNTMLDELDRFELYDFKAALEVLCNAYDIINLTDREPRTAISDFLIGAISGYDTAYDWLIPFDLKLDWGNTDILTMPKAELTYIEMPGIDGSIVEDTVYKDRLFTIVGYSEQGLSEFEKETIKSKITSILSTTKKDTKKLVVQDRGIAFDVRYDGTANITEGPSYVKAQIPFRAGPYGYDMFESELEGIGLIQNDGDVDIGVCITITGPVTRPSFTLGTQSYSYSGTVASGSSLVIDHNMMTCYIIDSKGNKTNALKNLNGAFQKIPAHSGVVLNTTSSTVKAQIKTTWKNKFLW